MYFVYFLYLNSHPTWGSLNCHFCVDHFGLGVTIQKEWGTEQQCTCKNSRIHRPLLQCDAREYLVNVPGTEDCEGKILKAKRWKTCPAMGPAEVEPVKLVAKALSSWVWFQTSWNRTKTFREWCRWSGTRRRRRWCWWRRWRWRWRRWPINLQNRKTGALDFKSGLHHLCVKTEKMKLARLSSALKIEKLPKNTN